MNDTQSVMSLPLLFLIILRWRILVMTTLYWNFSTITLDNSVEYSILGKKERKVNSCALLFFLKPHFCLRSRLSICLRWGFIGSQSWTAVYFWFSRNHCVKSTPQQLSCYCSFVDNSISNNWKISLLLWDGFQQYSSMQHQEFNNQNHFTIPFPIPNIFLRHSQ